MSSTDHGVDRDRPLDPKTRRTWLVAATGGGAAGGLLIALIVFSGGSGRAGLAGLLAGLAFGAAAGAAYGVGSAALDTVRGRPVGNSRLWSGGALFGLAFVCTIMLAGIGG
ncbi:MAG TPA: hypothetical protein VGA69_05345 [Nitriliruptorales bacterium]